MGSLAPKPKSLLGYYRILSPSAGVRVSPLCLACDKKTTFEILDYFFEQGGNFIDTANGYQGEESEEWLGEWMASRKNRDQMFYVHWWDFTTSIPELIQSLNRMILNGKVLYLGVSDTPAWVVVKANEYARQHGLTQFSVYQGQWSAAERDFERDILPMCQAEGMGLAPWGPLGSGRFKSKEQRERDGDEGRKVPTYEKYEKVTEKLEAIAKKKGTSITSVALAYVMHKAPYVFPIVGGRKIEHLKGNIEALSLELSDEEIDDIESAVPFDVGFPMNMLFGLHDPNFKYSTRMTSKDINLVKEGAYLDTPEKPRPIRPHKLE
ncbi:hypothetical protein H2199_008942 [Coniosporium tulheliwenetii]|uniref:Uncharacterized protein n=1 Tax=Coniosporium tulheliwenetii TaxID=3383036 RepID=A0ACC2YH25_9PEZI|nr:hypothetical protein H2199_008942 [Cladosporium sp. JES 115]